MGQLGRGDRRKTQKLLEHELGSFVQEPDRRFEDEIKTAERLCQSKGGAEGVAVGDVFWGEFAEDDVQEGDPEKGERDRNRRNDRVGGDVEQAEERLQRLRQKSFA